MRQVRTWRCSKLKRILSWPLVGWCHWVIPAAVVDCFSMDLLPRLPGVWKLTRQETNGSAGGTDTSVIDALLQPKQHQQPNQNNLEWEKPILLQLHANGRFRQCDEDSQEGNCMSGRWEWLRIDSSQTSPCGNNVTRICLALDRQYFGPPYDTLFQGDLMMTRDISLQEEEEEDISNNMEPSRLSFRGSIKIGKFNASKKDPAFFEKEPILISETTSGSFVLEQLFGFLSLLPEGATLKDQGNVLEGGFW